MNFKIKERFDELTPAGKEMIIWSLVGIVLLLSTVSGYNSRSAHKTPPPVAKAGKDIRLDPDLIDKTVLKEQRRKLDDVQGAVDKLQKSLDKVISEKPTADAPKEGATKPVATTKEPLPKIPNADEVEQRVAGMPYPPSMEQRGSLPVPVAPTTQPPKEKKIIGDITVVTNQGAKKEDKKKLRTVYLPPSFMEANLLTGFDAATSGNGKTNPEPLLLRIQTPAVLPNDIKANLAGCFVIAEAVGRLDKERADVRLVSLSCLSNEGRAIIDTQVKGFVTDSDSKVGLAGRVVSRMGAATARTIVAGFFGGAGDMLKASATTQTVSPLGVTNTVDSTQVAKYAVGGGLSEGAQSLHDFYLSLAKQATPVIEVGATKHITVIVSEGKDLEIKEKKQHDDDV